MSAPAGIWGQELADADDPTLLRLVREGDADAYAELWRRHLPAAYGVAHRHRGRTTAEDIVGEASLRVYDLIRAGKGPTTNFRSYFLATVKTVAVDFARAELRAVPTEDAGLEALGPVEAAYDPSAAVDHELVRVAFGRLPERDQQVLWRTAVEGVSPAVVATSMGMSANGVSVVALRARDSLRARYLDAHADRAIGRAEDEECRWVLAQLGRFVRGKLPVRQRARVEEHLRSCRHAQGLAYEMAEVNRALPALMVPLIFVAGSSCAAAWAGLAGTGGGGGGQDGKPSPLSGLLAMGGKLAALAVAATLGVGYAAGPGSLSALLGGGSPIVAAGGAAAAGGAGGGGGAAAGAEGAPPPAPAAASPATDPSAVPVPPAPPQSAADPTAAVPQPGLTGVGAPVRSTTRGTTTRRTAATASTQATPAATAPATTAPVTTTPPATGPSTPTTPGPTDPGPTDPGPPRPPVALGSNPPSAVGGAAFQVGVTFTGGAGGTVTVTLDGAGSLLLDCPDLAGSTCSFTGSRGVVGVTATPTAYPAAVVVTATNGAGGPPLTFTVPLTPPPPSLGGELPARVTVGVPFTVAARFADASGGTVSAALSPSGPVVLGCALTESTCRLRSARASFLVVAVPTAYPATLTLTLTNAAGGPPTTVTIGVDALPPRIVAPAAVTAGSTFVVLVDTGAIDGGLLTATATAPLAVDYRSGCTPAPAGCALGAQVAVVRLSVGPQQAAPASGGGAASRSALAQEPDPTTGEVTLRVTNRSGLTSSVRIAVREPQLG